MIPLAYIQAWRAKAPWPDMRQVEQDLIICRALCDLFSAPTLVGKIAFRGSALGRTQSQRFQHRIESLVRDAAIVIKSDHIS